MERVVVRSARGRRAVLLILVLGLATLCSLVPLLGSPSLHVAAGMRNVLGMVGLVALGYAILPLAVSWMPAIVTLGVSVGVVLPHVPSSFQTIWLFLKQPGGLSTSAGALDLSWPTALTLLVAGAVSYLSLHQWHVVGGHSRSRGRAGKWGQGLRSQMHFWPVTVLAGAVQLVLVQSVLAVWGGDLRLLGSEAYSSAVLVMVPMAGVIGLFLAQSRPRSGMNLFDRQVLLGVPRDVLVIGLHVIASVLVAQLSALTLIVLVTVGCNAAMDVPAAVTLGVSVHDVAPIVRPSVGVWSQLWPQPDWGCSGGTTG